MTREPAPDLMAAIAADLLAQARPLRSLSLGLALAAALALAGGAVAAPGAWMWAAGLSLASGLAQGLLAARTGFDEALFRRLGRQPDLAGFDAAMAALGLMPSAKTGRSMPARVAGARRLVALQAAALGAQGALLGLAAGLAALGRGLA
jgi:hypothetical protein